MNINDLPPRYRKQAERQIAKKNRAASAASNVESNTGNESMAKKKVEGYAPFCRINVHSVRTRLADPDGISAKAVLDGIVHANILRDDSARYIKEVSFSQEKTKGNEVTIIEIYSV